MNSHELAEKTAGLASRVNNLAVNQTGKESRELLQEQNRLARLAYAAMVKDLDEENEAYQAALSGLNIAIKYIGNADQQIEGVAEAIRLAAKAADMVETALKVAAM
ncbi:MAG: hypothetical protein KKD99_07490 [Proteobacteria bacterium]|nr:hypothetical protein [Pseudomonadota bacterium]MBU4357242.1 hypothetical protein [Pseudomonadota bacterium]MBU4448413.1 hypothetical protein [Pseudomonadota bacterium]MCG2771835.1 hypothetical protein [Desulfobacterales bacterium]